MGVRRTDYVFLGIKLNKEEQDSVFINKFGDRDPIENPYEDNGYVRNVTSHNGITTITDGMCGDYCFIGKVLAKGICDEGFVEEIDCTMTDEMMCLIYKTRMELDSEFKLNFINCDKSVKLWVFTHWH